MVQPVLFGDSSATSSPAQLNPYFVAGLANSRELVDWMYNPVWFKRIYKNYVVDPIVRGDTGIELPGGPIKIAFGGQFRRQDERVTMDAVSNRNNNPCTEIGVTNCDTTAAGRRVAVRPSADGVRRRRQRVPAGSAALPGGRGLLRDAAAAARARST